MPAKIREYTQETSAQAGIPGRRAQGSDFGGSGLEDVGRAITSAGQHVAAGYEKLERKREQDENIEIERQLAAARTQWNEDMLKRQQSAPPGAPEFTDKFKEDFDGYKEKVIGESNLSERSRSRLSNHLENLRAGLIDNAVRYEAAAGAAHARESVQSIFDQNANAVRANPDALQDIVAQEQRLAEGLTTLPAGAREALVRERKLAIHDAALDGTVDQLQAAVAAGNLDVGAIRSYAKELRENKEGFIASASPKAYARALDRLQQLDEHFTARNERIQLDGLQERIAEAGSGVQNGLARKEAAFIGDATVRAQYEKKIDIAVRMGEASRSVNVASHEDLMKMIESDSASLQKPGNYNSDSLTAKARLSAAQDRIRALKDDPAAYTLKNSEPVRSAYQKMVDSQMSPESVREYVTAMTVEQKRLAPWQGQPRLLSNDQIGQVKNQMLSVPTTPEGADQALQQLTSLQKQWGTAWPMVYRQLAEEKALTDAQIAAARMTDPTKQAAARVLLQASVTKESDLKQIIDQPNLDRDLRSSVNAALEPMYRAMDYQVGGTAEKIRNAEAVQTLALGYMMRGEPMAKAVQRAANEIVMSDFQWQGTYFLPRNVNAAQVKNGTQTVLRELDKYSFNPPSDLIGLREGDVKASAIDALRKGGVWVTNASNTGLVLTWPNAKREMVTTTDKSGKRVPFEFTWEQFKEMQVGKFESLWQPTLGVVP